MNITVKYKQTSLYELLNEPVPRLGRIETALRETPPELVQELLRAEPVSVFVLDYYLRKFDFEIGARIINHPALSGETLLELFNCQIIRYYLANLYAGDNHAISSPALIDSYWSRINHDNLQRLFKILISAGDNNRLSALGIMGNMSARDLAELKEDHSRALLDFVRKRSGEFESYITENLDLFDFIHREARNLKDQELLEILDQFTELAVRLRIAQNFALEAEELRDESGKIPFIDLVELVKRMPPDSAELTLDLLRHKNYVESETIAGILRYLRE